MVEEVMDVLFASYHSQWRSLRLAIQGLRMRRILKIRVKVLKIKNN